MLVIVKLTFNNKNNKFKYWYFKYSMRLCVFNVYIVDCAIFRYSVVGVTLNKITINILSNIYSQLLEILKNDFPWHFSTLDVLPQQQLLLGFRGTGCMVEWERSSKKWLAWWQHYVSSWLLSCGWIFFIGFGWIHF